MGTAKNPITVSGEFGINPDRLVALGVLDATLDIDTKLFIDPMRLKRSAHEEINKDAVTAYRERFVKVIQLLSASRAENDPAWKAAYKLFDFPEMQGTCLGYSAGTIRGSGWGPMLRGKTLKVAMQIVDLGVDNPDLFPTLALFEEKIGPDRICDMTATITLPALAKFNKRILKSLKLSGEDFTLGRNDYTFLVNPYQKTRTPIILVPTDILRELPVANDWDEVAAAASFNEDLRERVNEYVGSIWEKKSKRDKARLKNQAMADRKAFITLIDTMNAASGQSYDSVRDPHGLVRWARTGSEYAKKYPLSSTAHLPTSLDEVYGIVTEIIKQFKHLIEECGLNRELYIEKDRPRHESSAQRLFFAAAYSYCKVLNVDISPEIDTGNGKIDFKFSRGFDARVLVEIKLSTNHKAVRGFDNQLEAYKIAQQTTRAVYLIIDVGKMGRKDKDLILKRNIALKKGDPVSDLEFVDGKVMPSASKL